MIEQLPTILSSHRSRAKLLRKILIGIAALLAIGVTARATFNLRSRSSLQNEWKWDSISWRARLVARKAEGRVSDLSWRELWFMTRSRGGFGLEGLVTQAISLEGTVSSPYVTSEDNQVGARIFRARCVGCHGSNGTGAYAPALNRTRLSHGDSDFAIYKTVRDGIPQTGMAPVPMSHLERWQLVGYLRTLRVAAFRKNTEQLAPIDIHVSREQILAAGSTTDQWLTYSGSLDGRRYTPLAEINRENVSRLQVRWVRQTESSEPRTEATPIVAGGVIFTTEPTPSAVIAMDARSGELRWRYQRSLPDKLPTCCFRANRGLAILGNVLFWSTLDGYLVALDSTDGRVIWQTQVASPSDGFTMTGAPLVVNGSVVVGVSGGEYGIRGFVAAYDAETGRQQWKFITIPGPGEFGHDSWKNDAWRTGGGPTWITGSYDPSLDLIYWGTGNPSPGMQGDVRPGDNLFTNSLLALHASTGKLAWYFQFSPHDELDRDACQTFILVDIPIKGVMRHVLSIPNRNGFYYVFDRATGEFLVGVPFVEQNWAKGLDSTGRPIPSPETGSSTGGRLAKPGVGGGTNWQNPAFDPKSKTIFVPATESASVFSKSPSPRRGDLGFYSGSEGGDYKEPPQLFVRALDAATGARKWERWEHMLPNGYSGLLATGGGIVLGASGGYAYALDSATGSELWRVFLGGDTYAAPISLTVDGHQIILVSAGRAMFSFGL